MNDRSGTDRSALLSTRLDRALRWAATWHDGQHRKASPVPYIQHPTAVALMLDRLGYPEDVVIAGLLHDAAEDTEATLDDIRERFGERVAALVGHCSERKRDDRGASRPWIDRKREFLDALSAAPSEARAIVLADKLHNLRSIAIDLEDGLPVWDRFNAPRDRVLWYYGAVIDAARAAGDPRLDTLDAQCREIFGRLSDPAENPVGERVGDG